MGTIVLTFKANNCKTELPEAASRFALRKFFFIKFIHKSIGETANKDHLLQLNLLSNDIEVRLIKEASPKKSDKLFIKDFCIMSCNF